MLMSAPDYPVMLVIQAVTNNGFYYQKIHEMSDRGFLTVTYCYDIIIKFVIKHPDWHFVYTGCFY